jgi:hypothetical protein
MFNTCQRMLLRMLPQLRQLLRNTSSGQLRSPFWGARLANLELFAALAPWPVTAALDTCHTPNTYEGTPFAGWRDGHRSTAPQLTLLVQLASAGYYYCLSICTTSFINSGILDTAGAALQQDECTW